MTRLIVLCAAALMLSPPLHARGNAEAGKAKSAACAACHGVDGNSTVPSFPTLAGQHRDYLYHVLREYKSGKRKNAIMQGQVEGLSDADLADLAMFYSRQKGLYLKY